jgi:hypothetical protein
MERLLSPICPASDAATATVEIANESTKPAHIAAVKLDPQFICIVPRLCFDSPQGLGTDVLDESLDYLRIELLTRGKSKMLRGVSL